jgi:hypothetical protein
MKLRIDPLPVLHPADSGGQRRLVEILRRLSHLFNGRIQLGDGVNKENLDLQFKNVTSPATADQEFAVAHSLDRVPAGYFVVKRDKAALVYDSATSWTTSAIHLKCSLASTSLRLIIF